MTLSCYCTQSMGVVNLISKNIQDLTLSMKRGFINHENYLKMKRAMRKSFSHTRMIIGEFPARPAGGHMTNKKQL